MRGTLPRRGDRLDVIQGTHTLTCVNDTFGQSSRSATAARNDELVRASAASR
ncbi:Uncharacterised protein [Mycobacteroides abscessus subsp. abscessus]|nr:Uncharacterised protein [Mycobacteroides abscessus subsp. abscessus]